MRSSAGRTACECPQYHLDDGDVWILVGEGKPLDRYGKGLIGGRPLHAEPVKTAGATPLVSATGVRVPARMSREGKCASRARYSLPSVHGTSGAAAQVSRSPLAPPGVRQRAEGVRPPGLMRAAAHPPPGEHGDGCSRRRRVASRRVRSGACGNPGPLSRQPGCNLNRVAECVGQRQLERSNSP